MNKLLIALLILILLLLPLISPLLLKYLRKLIPLDFESKVVDWLNFYGAFCGALLALVTAFVIFNYQRTDSVRPYILFSREENTNTYPEFSTYFLENEKVTVIPDTRKISDPNRNEKFFIVKMKNIGQGAALNISLYDSSGRKATVFNKRMKILSKNDLTSIEVGGFFDFLFDFDLNKKYELNENNPNLLNETLRVSYNDIYGNNYNQRILFEFDKLTETGGLENRK